MKNEIHPAYNELVATCSCGNVIKVGSTRTDAIYLDVCSSCHPFYTGKQKVVDSGGRFRFVLQINASKRSLLQSLLSALALTLEEHKDSRRVRWTIDVDPQEI